MVNSERARYSTIKTLFIQLNRLVLTIVVAVTAAAADDVVHETKVITIKKELIAFECKISVIK